MLHDHPKFNFKIRVTLNEILLNQCLSEEDNNTFKWRVESDHISEALTLAKNSSATGMDGLPYELWKELSKTNESTCRLGNEGFDITKMLAKSFRMSKTMASMQDQTLP